MLSEQELQSSSPGIFARGCWKTLKGFSLVFFFNFLVDYQTIEDSASPARTKSGVTAWTALGLLENKLAPPG